MVHQSKNTELKNFSKEALISNYVGLSVACTNIVNVSAYFV